MAANSKPAKKSFDSYIDIQQFIDDLDSDLSDVSTTSNDSGTLVTVFFYKCMFHAQNYGKNPAS